MKKLEIKKLRNIDDLQKLEPEKSIVEEKMGDICRNKALYMGIQRGPGLRDRTSVVFLMRDPHERVIYRVPILSDEIGFDNGMIVGRSTVSQTTFVCEGDSGYSNQDKILRKVGL